MDITDGKEDQVRGASQGCDGYPSSDGNRKPGLLGHQNEDDALRADSQDWSKSTQGQSGSAGPGGIISQLIEETDYQLAEHEERIEKATARIQKYKERIKQLQNRKQELLLSLENWKADVVTENAAS